jgi:hypothetical protein
MCTGDADCTTGTQHAGPRCDTQTGACGNTCSGDTVCSAGQWCDDVGVDAGLGLCQTKVANGEPVPGGTCTAILGARACVTGVCDTKDNDCGIANGDACPSTDSGAAGCRSGACVTTGPNAGKCEGCATDANCTGSTPACSPTTNACVECTKTNVSACSGYVPVCNVNTNICAACAADNGSTNPLACLTAAAPFCAPVGACSRCTTNTECGGTSHPGPVCDVHTGACSACTDSKECGTGYWCKTGGKATGVCSALLPNGASLPSSPSSLSTCTDAVASEVCASGTCNTQDNACGPAPDAGVKDASSGADVGVQVVGASIEGGACAVRAGGAPTGKGSVLSLLVLAGAALCRRRRGSV